MNSQEKEAISKLIQEVLHEKYTISEQQIKSLLIPRSCRYPEIHREQKQIQNMLGETSPDLLFTLKLTYLGCSQEGGCF